MDGPLDQPRDVPMSQGSMFVCSFSLVAAGTPVAFISSPNGPCPNLKVSIQLGLPVSSGMVIARTVQVPPVFLAT